MNIERFKLPAIIAAGLHGALFLSMPDSTATAVTAATKITEVWLNPPPTDPVPLEPDPNDTHDDRSAGGGAKPLPSMPDLPPPLTGREPFTVPISAVIPSIVPVTTLRNPTGLPVGPEGTGESGPVGLPSVGSLDRVPRAMVQNPPDYPAGLRHDGIDGSVTVEFVVDTSGRVVTAEAVKWTRREFVDPAVRAVLRWRFEPGTLNGRKVRFHMAVPIEFLSAAR